MPRVSTAYSHPPSPKTRKMKTNPCEFETGSPGWSPGHWSTCPVRRGWQRQFVHPWEQGSEQKSSHTYNKATQKKEPGSLVRCTVGKQETFAINWGEGSTGYKEEKISWQIIKHWGRLPRQPVESPPFEVFKTQLDKALSNLIWNCTRDLLWSIPNLTDSVGREGNPSLCPGYVYLFRNGLGLVTKSRKLNRSAPNLYDK